MEDRAIIQAVLAGEKDEYRLLVEKYKQPIFRTCMGYVHQEDDANDLTQEVFINAYQKLHEFNFEARFSTWLYRIAVNLCLNFLRKKRRYFFEGLETVKAFWSNRHIDLSSSMATPEEIMISNEQEERIQQTIGKLPDKQKTAFILSKYEQLPQKEIAAIMNITEGAVESLLQRAKANLQKWLSNYFQKK